MAREPIGGARGSGARGSSRAIGSIARVRSTRARRSIARSRALGPTRRRGRAHAGRSMRQGRRRFRRDRRPKSAGLSTASMATGMRPAKWHMRQLDIRTQRVSPSAGQMALAVTSRRKCSRALLRSYTGFQSYVPRASRRPCLSSRARRMPTGLQA